MNNLVECAKCSHANGRDSVQCERCGYTLELGHRIQNKAIGRVDEKRGRNDDALYDRGDSHPYDYSDLKYSGRGDSMG